MRTSFLCLFTFFFVGMSCGDDSKSPGGDGSAGADQSTTPLTDAAPSQPDTSQPAKKTIVGLWTNATWEDNKHAEFTDGGVYRLYMARAGQQPGCYEQPYTGDIETKVEIGGGGGEVISYALKSPDSLEGCENAGTDCFTLLRVEAGLPAIFQSVQCSTR